MSLAGTSTGAAGPALPESPPPQGTHIAHPVHIAHIDGLRALSVLAVLVYHLEPAWLPGGFVGVDVFFAISGFVVAASLAGHGHEGLGRFLGQFYARRLARLIPGLVAMLLVATLAYVLLVPPAWFNRAAEDVGQAAFFGLSNWVLDRHAVNYFEPRAELNPYTHTWSLGVEEQFYLLAPLFLFVALRHPPAARRRWGVVAAVGLLAMVSLAATFYLGLGQGARVVFYHLAFRFWELAAGVLLFLTLPEVRQAAARHPRLARLAAPAGLGLVALAMVFPLSAAFPFARASVAVAGTLLLLGTGHPHPSDAVRRGLAHPLAVWIGQRSYALYLWHWPVFVLARWTVGLTVWPFNLAAVAVSLLLAALSYRWVERPVRSSARLRGWPLPSRIALGLALMGAGWGMASQLLDRQMSLGLGQVTRNAPDWYGKYRLLPTVRAHHRQCDPVTVKTGRGTLSGSRFEPRLCTVRPAWRLFVVGDSHAMAYQPLLEQFSAETGVTVTLLTTPGCSYLDLLDALVPQRDAQCYRVARDALASVLAEARPGDTVFLPSLRLPRLVELGGARRPGRPDVYTATAAESAARERAILDAPSWIDPLTAAGLDVVLEAPKPLFRAHPFTCVEAWQRWNPDCAPGLTERRGDLERFRAPVLAALTQLAARDGRIRLWDPLPALCEAATCTALRQGRPLFFDADHLSPYGNLVLLEPFRATIRP